MRLEHRIALVTGAGRGIGRAIAIAFAKEGADLVLAARTGSEIDAVATEVEALGRKALAVPTDVADAASVTTLVERALSVFERIDILVNNAGVMHLAPVLGTDPETWRRTLEVNLTGAFLLSRAVLPNMLERRRGKIVNIASRAGMVPTPMAAAYAASKCGLIGLTRSLSEEVKKMGIQVNALCPGFVDTKLVHDTGVGSMLEEIMAPGEIAEAVLFLASEASSSITGAAIEAYGATERPSL